MLKPPILSITGMLLPELEALCASMKEPVYRAKQILSWVYEKGATTFDRMSNLPKSFRTEMEKKCSLFQTRVDAVFRTDDNSEKFLIHLSDGNLIESVLLREGTRITACVSSQVGCAMACRFCASGLLGLERDLATGEIVEQMLHIKNRLLSGERITNVVFMGIGEPLANYDNVIGAIRIINAPWGTGIGARHITLSTVGIPGSIRRLSREGLQVNLAISLHAPSDAMRQQIVPANKKTGIQAILAATQEYFKATGRDISFEYVLIDGVNSSKQDAESLARLLKGIQCNVNLLPVNPVEEFHLAPPDRETVEIFYETLQKYGIITTLRKRKGDDVHAACGQLRIQNTKFYGKR
ncbi:MAG: hypothetical protein HW390_2748 [Candidatus Brocadiaceae bacterium]|nr:hypothetical protein [Candidatus Brocadiaceae bacterium]